MNASADGASSLTLKPSDAPVRAASLDACIESEGTLDADDRSVQATVDWGDVEFTSPNSIGTEDWTAAESEVPLCFLNYQIDGQDGQVETTEFSPSVWDASFDVLEGGSFEGPSLLGNTNAVLEIVSEFASMIGDHDFSAEGEPLETGHVEEVEFQPYQSPGSSPVCMDSPSLSREIDLVEPSKLFLLRHCEYSSTPKSFRMSLMSSSLGEDCPGDGRHRRSVQRMAPPHPAYCIDGRPRDECRLGRLCLPYIR